MSILSTIKHDTTVNTEEKDTLGGGGYTLLDSDIYPMTISAAYLGESAGGAVSVSIALKAENGTEHRETIWITNKSKQTTYTDKNDGSQQPLPGFLLADSLALLTANKSILQLDTEDKVINLYDYSAGKEVPTTVPMLMELVGKQVYAGIMKVRENKTKKNEATGKYDPINEARERNEVTKFFYAADKRTTAEIRAQAAEPAFYAQWKERYAGQVKDTYKEVAAAPGSAGAAAGRPSLMGGTQQAPTQQAPAAAAAGGSLFG